MPVPPRALERAVASILQTARDDGGPEPTLRRAWTAALKAGAGAARRILARSDPDLDDVASHAALRALADLRGGWADLAAVRSFSGRQARSAALNLLARRGGRGLGGRRRVDPLVHAQPLLQDLEAPGRDRRDDLLAAALRSAAALPPAQRAAVARRLRPDAPDRRPASPAERKAWARARAAIRASVTSS